MKHIFTMFGFLVKSVVGSFTHTRVLYNDRFYTHIFLCVELMCRTIINKDCKVESGHMIKY